MVEFVKHFMRAMLPFRYCKVLHTGDLDFKASSMLLEVISSLALVLIASMFTGTYIAEGFQVAVESLSKGEVLRSLIVAFVFKIIGVAIGWDEYKRLSREG